MGHGTYDIGHMKWDIGQWRWFYELWKVGGGGGWVVHLDYNVSSGPFLSSELILGPGPGPELENLKLHSKSVFPFCICCILDVGKCLIFT